MSNIESANFSVSKRHDFEILTSESEHLPSNVGCQNHRLGVQLA